MQTWKTFELGSVCKRLSSGKGISSKQITSSGEYPVFGGNGIRGYTHTANFCGDCAIIGRQGAYCGNVRFFSGSAYMTEHAVVVCANSENNTRYLAYLLSTLNLGRLSGQSAQPGLSVKTLANHPITLPHKNIQDRIVSILASLDDKISINTTINNNLEQQAQMIYTHMFINDESYKWTRGTLSDIATITMGQSPNGKTYNEDGIGTVFFQGRGEFSFRFPTRRLFTTDPKRIAKANDVLLSVRAPVGDLNVAYEECCIGRGLASIRSNTGHKSFILYTMYSLKDKLDTFNGEGTVFGSINRDALSSIPILIPPSEKIENFEYYASPIDEIIRNNYEETNKIEHIRDILLTKLMSGELDVSDLDI